MVGVILILKGLAAMYILHCILTLLMRWYRLHKMLEWVPGPTSIPFFGGFKFIGKDQSEIVLILQKWRKEYGSIYKHWLGGDPVLNVQEPEMIKKLSNTGKMAHKSLEYRFFEIFCGESLLTSAEDTWYRKRKLITPCFHYEILDTFLECMNNHALKFPDHLSKYADTGKSFDFLQIAKLCTLDVLLDTTMGVIINALENEDNPYVKASGNMKKIIMAKSMSPLYRNDILYSFSKTKKLENETVKILGNFVKEVIRSKKELRRSKLPDSQENGKKKKALLDFLLDLNDNGENISDQEIQNEVNTFIFAGHDTTSVALSYVMYLLGRHQDLQEKVYNEINDKLDEFCDTGINQSQLNKLELLDRFFKESLRLYPPIPLIGKLFKKPFETVKGTIPEEVNITENIFNLHRDESLYPQPDRFDPDRFLLENINKRHPYAFIPFGTGARNCIGQKFAQNEIKTIVIYILKKYRIESVDQPEDLKLGFDIVLTPMAGIHLKINRR